MKSNFTLIFLILLANFASIIAQQSEITTVIIVRHAEKEVPAENMQAVEMSKQGDVKLTKMGEQRAVKLAEMLSESEVSAVFSTNTTRTIETVNNYADKNGLEIFLYDDTGELAENIISEYGGEKILVSAHSNTIGALMKSLGTESVPQIEHDYYSGFFIVTITSGGSVSWLHLEY